MSTIRKGWLDRRSMFSALFPTDGVVVEVGSQKGRSAAQIRAACSPRILILVDVWRYLEGEYERDPANRPTPMREREMSECAARVGKYPDVVMYRELSQNAVGLFTDESLDAVYLDADHTREGIERDLGLWWPKVRAGGVLAGHDYTDKIEWVDVKPVVDEFVEREGLDLFVTEERAAHEVRRPHADVDGCVFASWAVRK